MPNPNLIERDGVPQDQVFRLWISRFIQLSGEHERSVDSILDQMKDSLSSGRGRLWTFEDWKNFHGGYMLAEIIQTEKDTIGVMVQQVYVPPKFGYDMWSAIHEALEEFGRERGASEMYFLTRRDHKAFERRLGRGWKKDATVMLRKIP